MASESRHRLESHPRISIPTVILIMCLGIAWFAFAHYIRGKVPLQFLWPILAVAGVIAGVMALISLVLYLIERLLNREIYIEHDGFRIMTRFGDIHFTDDNAVAVSIYRESIGELGERRIVRTACLWMRNGSHGRGVIRVKMINTHNVKSADPLAEFLERITALLLRKYKCDMSAGNAVGGKGWIIKDNVLKITHGQRKGEVPISEVGVCEIIDEHVCVWRRENKFPLWKIPTSASNSLILYRILTEVLSDVRDKSSGRCGGMGRVRHDLVYIDMSVPMRIGVSVVVVMGLLFLTYAVVSVNFSAVDIRSGGFVIALIAIAMVEIMFVLIVMWWTSARLRIHENGVSLDRWWCKTEVRYDDIVSLKWAVPARNVSATCVIPFSQSDSLDLFSSYDYSRINIVIAYGSKSGKRRRIKWAKKERDHEAAYAELRSIISEIVGSKMCARFSSGEEVAWTPTMTITHDGLLHRSAGILGKKEPMLIPYADIANFNIDEGYFRIWRTQDEKSSINESFNQDNFFPGFYLFCRVMDDLWKAKEQFAASPQRN